MKLLVTGATGFLGNAFASDVLAGGGSAGDGLKVSGLRAAGRNAGRAKNLVEAGAEFIAGEIQDPACAARCVEGMDVVIHCAGRSGLGGPMRLYRAANQEGTRVLLEAARAAGVRRIVNIGTPSIYFDYTDTLDRDEDYLPARPADNYAASKHEAELMLLDANGRDIETISLRPRFTSGRGETNILGRFIAMHRAGKFKRIGGGDNVADFTSVSNMVRAMRLAATTPAENCGLACNITNGEPVKLWPFLDRVMERVGLPPVTSKVPYPVAAAAGSLIGLIHAMKGTEPPISRLGAAVMAKSMTMSILRARTRLGYDPVQTNDEMLEEFAADFLTRDAG